MRNKIQQQHDDTLVKTESLLLDCPECNSFISAQDVDIEHGRAKCSHCDHVFSFEEAKQSDPIAPPDHTQPAGLDVLRLRSMLDIQIRHLHAFDNRGFGFVMFFTLLWNAALLPFLFYIFSSGQIYLLLFISMHLFAGIYLISDVLGKLFNKTSIEVDPRQIRVTTGPVVLPGQKEKILETSKIEQLFVTRTKGQRKPGVANFTLSALLKNGRKVALIKGLDRPTLRYVEQEVERYLKIEDRKV